MSAPKLRNEHSAQAPWTPPPADAEWFADPVKRGNHLALLRKHNEREYLEAVDFYEAWRSEFDDDARVAGSTA